MIAVMALTTFTASARIGKTQDECDALYGKWEVKDANDPIEKYGCIYQKGDMVVVCYFLKSKTCNRVVYAMRLPGGLEPKKKYLITYSFPDFDNWPKGTETKGGEFTRMSKDKTKLVERIIKSKDLVILILSNRSYALALKQLQKKSK